MQSWRVSSGLPHRVPSRSPRAGTFLLLSLLFSVVVLVEFGGLSDRALAGQITLFATNFMLLVALLVLARWYRRTDGLLSSAHSGWLMLYFMAFYAVAMVADPCRSDADSPLICGQRHVVPLRIFDVPGRPGHRRIVVGARLPLHGAHSPTYRFSCWRMLKDGVMKTTSLYFVVAELLLAVPTLRWQEIFARQRFCRHAPHSAVESR